MVLKKTSQEFEGAFSGARQGLAKLPGQLLKEMSAFIERNPLATVACEINGKKPVYYTCQRCLKAHLLKKCKELDLGCEKELKEIFDCEAGHEGYYTDEEKLCFV